MCIRDSARIGRILIVKIKQIDASKARAALFNKHDGAQVVHAEKLQGLYNSLIADNANVYDLLKSFVAELPAWQKALRYGATHHLQRALLLNLVDSWPDVKEKYKQLEDLAELLTLLKLVKAVTAMIDQKE